MRERLKENEGIKMLPNWRRSYNLILRRGVVPLAAVALVAITCTTAEAQLGNIGFEIKLSEKEMVLEHPNDPVVQKFAAWDPPFQRIADRNMPFIEVKNLSTSTGNLTEFRMTIGDTDFNFSDDFFGTFVKLGTSTPNVNLSATTAMNGDELIVTFGNGGLAPGELVRFRIDLDPDPNTFGLFPHPDFRLVLFSMNGMDDSFDNSIVSALFVDPNDPANTATVSNQLPDFTVTGAQSLFFNQFIRPYSQMEGVDIFALQAAEVIPEPSTVTLAVAGLLAIAAVARRQRPSPPTGRS